MSRTSGTRTGLAYASGLLLSAGTSWAAAAPVRQDERIKANATRRIRKLRGIMGLTKVEVPMYRQSPGPPVLFVGASRHFVEGHFVVSAHSPRGTSER